VSESGDVLELIFLSDCKSGKFTLDWLSSKNCALLDCLFICAIGIYCPSWENKLRATLAEQIFSSALFCA
jgi:hypothetical protein